MEKLPGAVPQLEERRQALERARDFLKLFGQTGVTYDKLSCKFDECVSSGVHLSLHMSETLVSKSLQHVMANSGFGKAVTFMTEATSVPHGPHIVTDETERHTLCVSMGSNIIQEIVKQPIGTKLGDAVAEAKAKLQDHVLTLSDVPEKIKNELTELSCALLVTKCSPEDMQNIFIHYNAL